MAWTTPKTYSVGEEATAAMFNTYQRDNLQYLFDRLAGVSGTPSVPVALGPGAGAFQAGNTITLTAGTWFVLQYYAAAMNDTGSGQFEWRFFQGAINGPLITDVVAGAASGLASSMVPCIVAPTTTTSYIASAFGNTPSTLYACFIIAMRTAA